MIVGKLKSHVPGHKYYVAADGRVMGGRDLRRATAEGTTVKRKPGHLYYVDGAGAVHEKKAKYT